MTQVLVQKRIWESYAGIIMKNERGTVPRSDGN